MELRFVPEEHRYFLGDKELPSVSRILKAVFPKEFERVIDPWYAERGTAVHEATRLHDQGVLDETTVDQEVMPYLSAYRKFLSETGFKPIHIESSLSSEIHGFAGTPDRVGDLNGRRVLIDLKSGGPQWWHKYQLAGYAVLCQEVYREEHIEDRFGLYLKSNGTYKLKDLGTISAYEFTYILGTYKIMKREGIL